MGEHKHTHLYTLYKINIHILLMNIQRSSLLSFPLFIIFMRILDVIHTLSHSKDHSFIILLFMHFHIHVVWVYEARQLNVCACRLYTSPTLTHTSLESLKFFDFLWAFSRIHIHSFTQLFVHSIYYHSLFLCRSINRLVMHVKVTVTHVFAVAQDACECIVSFFFSVKFSLLNYSFLALQWVIYVWFFSLSACECICSFSFRLICVCIYFNFIVFYFNLFMPVFKAFSVIIIVLLICINVLCVQLVFLFCLSLVFC